MIEVKNLVKQFDTVKAVDSISFSVPKGQILGFLGPNGAGKSTTMKMLTGFISPTSGTAEIGGYDIRTDSVQVRRQLGYLPESAPSYGEMTVCEFLHFIAGMRDLHGAEATRAAEQVRETCALKGVWHQSIETLSKGYRQRVGFAQALLHDPPVLILDEPTDGLDPNQKHEVRRLIRNMGRDKTIVLSTHILEEVEAICERVIIIAEGRIVSDATPDDLLEKTNIHNAVTLRFFDSGVEKARGILGSLDGVSGFEEGEEGRMLRCFSRDGKPILETISGALRKASMEVKQIQVEQGRLDEVFRSVTLPEAERREYQ